MIIAEAARSFLLPHWRAWHELWGPPAPARLSQWTCVRSSIFLTRSLKRYGVGATYQSGRPVSGAPNEAISAVGVLSASGWVSHAWVEAEGYLIDITADQFGQAPIILSSTDNPAYRKGDCPKVQLSPTPAGVIAVDEIWPAWCANTDRQRQLTGGAGSC